MLDLAELRQEGLEAPALRCGELCTQAADEIDRLRAALQDILNIETRLGFPAGLDMQCIAKKALNQ